MKLLESREEILQVCQQTRQASDEDRPRLGAQLALSARSRSLEPALKELVDDALYFVVLDRESDGAPERLAALVSAA